MCRCGTQKRNKLRRWKRDRSVSQTDRSWLRVDSSCTWPGSSWYCNFEWSALGRWSYSKCECVAMRDITRSTPLLHCRDLGWDSAPARLVASTLHFQRSAIFIFFFTDHSVKECRKDTLKFKFIFGFFIFFNLLLGFVALMKVNFFNFSFLLL